MYSPCLSVGCSAIVRRCSQQWRSQGWAWQGLGPPKCLLCTPTEIKKRSIYSNRPINYSNKAVSRPGGALAPLTVSSYPSF